MRFLSQFCQVIFVYGALKMVFYSWCIGTVFGVGWCPRNDMRKCWKGPSFSVLSNYTPPVLTFPNLRRKKTLKTQTQFIIGSFFNRTPKTLGEQTKNVGSQNATIDRFFLLRILSSIKDKFWRLCFASKWRNNFAFLWRSWRLKCVKGFSLQWPRD